MAEEHNEVVGFLCRWLLLVVAGSTVLATVWLSIASVGQVMRDLDAAIVTPDAVVAPTSRMYISGRLIPAPEGNAHQALCSDDATLRLAGYSPPNIYVPLVIPSPGLHHLRVVGVPYGAYAMERQDVLVLAVPQTRRICLVDARLAMKLLTPVGLIENRIGEERFLRDLETCLHEIRSRWELAFFHVGPPEEYASVREAMQSHWPGAPVLAAWPAKPNPAAVLQNAIRALAFLPSNRPVVVTLDADLGKTAGSGGAKAFCISFDAPAAATTPAPAGLSSRATETISASALKDYLLHLPTGN